MQGSIVELGGMGKLSHEEVARCPLLLVLSPGSGHPCGPILEITQDLLPGRHFLQAAEVREGALTGSEDLGSVEPCISLLTSVSSSVKRDFVIRRVVMRFQQYILGTSLVVQWLRLYACTVGARVQSLVRELRSRKPRGPPKNKQTNKQKTKQCI